MERRTPFVRRHIHAWRNAGVESLNYGVISVTRECTECYERQQTSMTCAMYESLPPSVVHLADTIWHPSPRRRGCKP